MKLKRIAAAAGAIVILSTGASAQERLTPEQQEKQLYESIEKQVDRMTENLKLADWQIFYADSILTHNYTAMSKELEKLSSSKVSNSDLYYAAQDKWMEATYNAFRKILNDQQWEKYLKTGAMREKKARDKRAAKRK